MMRCNRVPWGRVAVMLVATSALVACGGDSSKDKTVSIGGTVAGVNGILVLQNNGGDNLSLGASGAFTFAGELKKGSDYSVTISTQPAGQTCTVANGSGTASADVTNVAVTCADLPAYTVGGTVEGLDGSVVLQNDPDTITVSANGAFTFPTSVRQGLGYFVNVVTQPVGQTCVVAGGTGSIGNENVTNVAVTCTDGVTPTMTFSIGGTVSGLNGGTLQLRLQDLDAPASSVIDITADGPFNFDPQKVRTNHFYLVTVAAQPVGQACTLTGGTGQVRVSNVTNVIVTCSASSATYSIGGTISGLTGAGLKIENGATNAVTPAAGATTFTLPNEVANNFEYDVGIAAQPAGQTCVLIKSHGVVNAADVTNVDVRCIANVTDPIVGTYTVPALVPGSYVYITFFADGVYIYASVENNGPDCGASTSPEGNGVEYGVYNYDATTHVFTIKSAVVDTNGGCGVWAPTGARYSGTLSIANPGTQDKVMTLTLPGGSGQLDLVPVDSVTGQIIGTWATAYQKNFTTFIPAGGNNLYYMITETQQDNAPTSTGHIAGLEYACASTTALTGGNLTADLTATCQAPAPSTNGAVDTNGEAGLSTSPGTVQFTVTVDTLTPQGATSLNRIKPN